MMGESKHSGIEELFILSVLKGDRKAVLFAIENVPDLNINCTNEDGKSALVLAIEDGNAVMIKILLDHDIELGDSLLRAVDEQYVQGVRIICKHIKRLDNLDLINCRASNGDFHPEVTPVVLAAHHNNYEILRILLDHGVRIKDPKDFGTENNLENAVGMLNLYKAFASQSYISLTADDPIQTTFELCSKLRKLSVTKFEFHDQFHELAEQCEDFAAALLDKVRNADEQALVLTHDPSQKRWNPSDIRNAAPKKVKVAIEYDQRKFVAHPHCQQKLVEQWYRGLPGWRDQDSMRKLFLVMCLGFAFPLFSIAYLINPESSLGRYLCVPYIQFVCHTASQFCFLLLLLGHSIIQNTHNNDIRVTDEITNETVREQVTENDGSWMMYILMQLIFLWVLGMTWAKIKEMWMQRLKFFVSLRNISDFLIVLMCWLIFILRLSVFSRPKETKLACTQLDDQSVCDALGRISWGSTDPALIAEAVFAVVKVLSFLRMISLTVVNRYVGPMQISLGGMIFDIIKFILIFSFVWFAFSLGMNQLYYYYSAFDSNRDFATIFSSLKILFWALFGLPNFDITHLPNGVNHHFTQTTGELLYAVYNIIAIVVMMNILIAMMSNTYTRVEEDADVEWKFSRSKLIMTYFDGFGVLPPPFNAIPSVKSIKRLFKCISYSTVKHKDVDNTGLIKKDRMRIIADEQQTKFKEVSDILVKRYHFEQRHEEEDDEQAAIIKELKQDMSGFKFEMFEALAEIDKKIRQVEARFKNESVDEHQGIESNMFQELRDAVQNVELKRTDSVDSITSDCSMKMVDMSAPPAWLQTDEEEDFFLPRISHTKSTKSTDQHIDNLAFIDEDDED